MAFNSLYSDKDTPSRLYPHLIDDDDGPSDAINAAFAAGTIGIGDIIRTAGYHEGSDLGGCTYRVVASATGTDDGGSYIDFTGFQLEAVARELTLDQFGARDDGTTNNKAAFEAALAFGRQWVMESAFGTYYVSGGLTMDKPYFRISGKTALTTLSFDSTSDGLFVGDVSTDSSYINDIKIEDCTIQWSSAVAKTLVTFDGVIRSRFERVTFHGQPSGGYVGALATCMSISYSFILTFKDCYWRYGAIGIDSFVSPLRVDTTRTSMNGVWFTGGEVHNNVVGVRLEGTKAVTFSTTIEGSAEKGVHTVGRNSGLNFTNTYFELNAIEATDPTHCDLHIGDSTIDLDFVSVVDNFFEGPAASGQSFSIFVDNASVEIEGNVTHADNVVAFIHNGARANTDIVSHGNYHSDGSTATIDQQNIRGRALAPTVDRFIVSNASAKRALDTDAANGAADLAALKTVVADLADVVATFLSDQGRSQAAPSQQVTYWPVADAGSVTVGPLASTTGTQTAVIDWGDGSGTEALSTNSVATLTHAYTAFTGTMTITLPTAGSGLTRFSGSGKFAFALSSLPSTLERLSVTATGGTVTGALGHLPHGMTYFEVVDGLLITGDVAELPPLLTHCVVFDATNTIGGDVGKMPINMGVFWVNGLNTLSGSLRALPRGLTQLLAGGLNTLSGSISDLPDALSYYNVSGSNTIDLDGTYTPAAGLSLFNHNGLGLDAADVNAVLVAIEALGTSGGAIDLANDNAAPTGAGVTAKSTLIGRSWTVSTN